VTRRDAAALDVLEQLLGADLALDYAGPSGAWEDADLRTARTGGLPPARDVSVARGVDAAVQMLVNRLQTRRGELAPLGHPDYGSRHHDLVGEPNVERTRNLVKVFVLEALRQEPRVAKVVRATVQAAHEPPRDVVRIEVDLLLVDHAEPLNLVVPFALGAVS
jgi:phage baseplate assembly protein W